ncbi:MFS transporter [Enterobacter hormaechei]
MALNSLGSHQPAIGLALGGFLLSLAGPWMVFAPERALRGRRAWAWRRWRPAPSVQRLPPEHFFSAVRSGIGYVHAAPVLRNVLVRTVAFFVFGSAGWAAAAGGAPRAGLRPGGLRRNAGVHWPGRLPGPFCCLACASG